MHKQKKIENLLIETTYLPKEDQETIKKAYLFAEKAHKGQFRKSKAPYIHHPTSVSIILAELKQDTSTICAGLLHDTIEDTPTTDTMIKKEFGSTISHLVDGVTKLGKLTFDSKEERQAENYRKMFLAMAQDIRVVIIKLADRLHNMRTLSYLNPQKQTRIARETREIYSPLAHRLGMWSLKWEFEDLAFSILDPVTFEKIKKMVASHRKEREVYVESMIKSVKTLLKKNHIKADISGRPKHFYSIYKKLSSQTIPYEELYDTLGLRIKVETIKECYECLGIIHADYKPISGRIKDYISVPKSNLYQSLHTTVIGSQGKPVEIQIRTHEMHQIAEYGIAAHWQYKEGHATSDADFTWLRQILELQKETQEPGDYMNELKLDLFIDEVFVFSPKGHIQVLPKQSTPIDFAYRIHTEIGHSCTGAKVNNKIVPLDYVLQNGDRIEILTSKKQQPKLDWLNFVKTNQSKNNIKQWYKKQHTQQEIQYGKKKLEKALLISGILPPSFFKDKTLSELKKTYPISSFEDLFAKIARNEMTAKEIVTLYQKHKPQPDAIETPKEWVEKIKKQTTKATHHGISVLGERNISVRLPKCCHPLPGDQIIGFITIGQGIAVHRESCIHILKISDEKRIRLIEVEWDHPKEDDSFPISVVIEAFDRVGLLQDIIQYITTSKINIRDISIKKLPDGGTALIHLIIDIHSLNELNKLKTHIQKIKDVLSIKRTHRE